MRACVCDASDDGHAMKSVTSEDLRGWIEEVYQTGAAFALQMARDGNKKIDPSLFENAEPQKLPNAEVQMSPSSTKAVAAERPSEGSRKSSKASTTDV